MLNFSLIMCLNNNHIFYFILISILSLERNVLYSQVQNGKVTHLLPFFVLKMMYGFLMFLHIKS